MLTDLAQAAQLQVAEHVDERATQPDGGVQVWLAGEHLVLVEQAEHLAAGAGEFVEHPLGEVGSASELEEPRCQPVIGLGQAHLGDVDEGGEDRPLAIRRSRQGRVTQGLEPAAEAVPPREVDPGHRPGEHPRDRPQVLEAATAFGAAAAARPRPPS